MKILPWFASILTNSLPFFRNQLETEIKVRLCESVCFIYLRWLTVVEGDLRTPFSIATTQRCKEEHYSFPCIAPLILDPYFIMLTVNQGGIKYHFLSLLYNSTWDWTLISIHFTLFSVNLTWIVLFSHLKLYIQAWSILVWCHFE